jgi:SAM-dependent methyltransferase
MRSTPPRVSSHLRTNPGQGFGIIGQTHGLTNCKFQEGDASNLHELKDHTFDLVVSIFGAMFAPKPFDAAKEMVRVTRPGGRIIMGNWIPNDPTLVAQILKISSSYSPPPPEGFISPMTWGNESNVIERFGAAGVPKEKISCVRDTYTSTIPVHHQSSLMCSESTTGRP